MDPPQQYEGSPRLGDPSYCFPLQNVRMSADLKSLWPVALP